MAWRPALDSGAISAVRARLEANPFVECVLFDEHQNVVCVICDPSSDVAGLLSEVQASLLSEGIDPGSLRVELVVRPEGQGGGRARFNDIQVLHEPGRRVRVRVTLEWEGRRVTGEAVGEAGSAIELRTTVTAALSALEQLTQTSLGIRSVGVKQIRAFDAELIVVSLYREAPGGQKLLGAVLAGSDPHRSAALALLNALNRVLGTYISTR